MAPQLYTSMFIYYVLYQNCEPHKVRKKRGTKLKINIATWPVVTLQITKKIAYNFITVQKN